MENATQAANQPRQLTQQEVQRFCQDAWDALQKLISPSGGVLDGSSYSRITAHAAQNHLDALREAFSHIHTDYLKAVELQAQAWYTSVKELLHAPSTPNQKTYDPLYLQWKQEPRAVMQRRSLFIENISETQKIAPDKMLNRVTDEKKADAVAQAQKDHDKAVKQIEVAISGIVFQNFRGIDQAEIDRVRTDLSDYVKKNLSKSNGVKILGIVTQSIAGAHQAYECKQTQWNSR